MYKQVADNKMIFLSLLSSDSDRVTVPSGSKLPYLKPCCIELDSVSMTCGDRFVLYEANSGYLS